MVFIHISLLILQISLFVLISYLLILTVAALQVGRKELPIIGKFPRFAILIPAHNEEDLISKALESILANNYPRLQFDIYVIADNCSDDTVAQANIYGVNVLVRNDLASKGKGYALNWGYQLIRKSNSYDAYIFIDADTVVDISFLAVMAIEFSKGEQAVQSYYTVKAPQTSWNTSLRYVALAVLHYLRPLGRVQLGGSAGLKGNGMMLTQEILDKHSWSGSITEDIEFHMKLVLDGIRVQFAPQAVVYGEMPETFSRAQSQLDRWEQGRLDMVRRYVPFLLQLAGKQFKKRQFVTGFLYLDACMEHIIPPFSVLFGATVVGLGSAIILFSWVFFTLNKSLISIAVVNMGLGLFLVIGEVLYILIGLRMVQAPAWVYTQLLYTPWFVSLKIKQYIKILFQRESLTWVKTQRNDG